MITLRYVFPVAGNAGRSLETFRVYDIPETDRNLANLISAADPFQDPEFWGLGKKM